MDLLEKEILTDSSDAVMTVGRSDPVRVQCC